MSDVSPSAVMTDPANDIEPPPSSRRCRAELDGLVHAFADLLIADLLRYPGASCE